MDHAELGVRDPLHELVLVELVHKEANGAPVHTVDRHAGPHEAMQRLQHQAVPAQGDDDIRLFRLGRAIASGQALQGVLRFRRGTCNKANPRLIRAGRLPWRERYLRVSFRHTRYGCNDGIVAH